MLKNQKGFSLLELLISIAILLILAASFVPLMSTSFNNIYYSGDKNKAVFDAQKEIEELFSKGSTHNNHSITILFPGASGTVSVTIPGESVSISKDYGNGNSITLDAFIPAH